MDSELDQPRSGRELQLELEYDLLDRAAEQAVLQSAMKLLAHIDPAEARSPTEDEGRYLRHKVWPELNRVEHVAAVEPTLVLIPLNRLGVPLGFSGSNVMVGYFRSNNASLALTPSRPMIVKFARTEEDGRDKLLDEAHNARALEAYVFDDQERYALPLLFHPVAGPASYSVLWSPFASNKRIKRSIVENPKLEIQRIQDFLELLRDPEAHDMSCVVLREACGLVKQLHGNYHGRNPLALYSEYEWYLRGVDAPSGWGQRWRAIWGDVPEVEEFGARWANPFHILSQIQNLPPFPLYCGAVHGDFHPRNVILAGTEQVHAHLIDYGWSKDCAHVAKDYALLECNLRFGALPSAIPFADMRSMAGWIAFGESPPDLTDAWAGARCDLIVQLRRAVADVLDSAAPECGFTREYWTVEYSVPLFLVALGLMKYLPGFDNHVAARMTVLSLASHLRDTLPDVIRAHKSGALEIQKQVDSA